jgi:hypothetical protein
MRKEKIAEFALEKKSTIFPISFVEKRNAALEMLKKPCSPRGQGLSSSFTSLLL